MLFVTTGTFVVSANESISFGEDYTGNYTFDAASGNLIIGGTGKIPCIAEYIDEDAVKTVTIQSGITTIGWQAFSGCENLTSVSIPDSVKIIDRYAFSGCTSLKSISLPDNVEEISSDAFYKSGVYNNSANWDNGVFYVDGYILSVDGNVFSSSDYTIKDGTKVICEAAFKGKSCLKKINIPDSVRVIGEEAFLECTSLESVSIPGGVQVLGGRAFEGCTSLAEISIPDTVKVIGHSVFWKTAYYDNQSNWENGALYIGKHLVATDYDAISSEYKVKAGTLTISGSAFVDCSSLYKVTIPDSVVTIGLYAFADCYLLKSVEMPANLSYIGERAFSCCGNLRKVELPGTLEYIGEDLFFDCATLSHVSIGNGITEIPAEMFRERESLKTVDIPVSVTSVGDSAFVSTGLEEVNYGGSESEWKKVVVSDVENEPLLSAKINYNAADSENPDEDASKNNTVSPAVIIGAAAGGIIVAAVVAVIFVLKKRK